MIFISPNHHLQVNNAGILAAETDRDAFTAAASKIHAGEQFNWSALTTETYELAEEGLKTNYFGAKMMCETFIPLLQLSDSPRIVSVSASIGKLQNLSNEWAKSILSDAENLTEERVDDVCICYWGKQSLRITPESQPYESAFKMYAVVTGANKGIGLGICKQLASKGVTVVLTARDEKRGIEAVEKLRESGLSDFILFHQLDVADPASIASLADFIKSQFGKLDILVNNAGIRGAIADDDAIKASDFGKPGAQVNWTQMLTQTHELAEEGLKTNYYGAKRMCEALIPLLQLSDSPRIVNVSSSAGKLEYVSNEWAKAVLGDVGNLTEERVDEVLSQYLQDYKEGSLETKGWPAYLSAYKLSKAAMNAYTRILAKKYPGICINCVCPGYVKTDINYYSGILSVEEGAEGPVRLALLPHGSPSGFFFEQLEEEEF
ncbi:hypothetical protein SLEP1_g10073 [Rubroshorea leprosula]|uniref:(+)-neomenthol dehydrogenase n=1 Tax=Rubroshorea leprosula TaxID=152421 RepID=A0AAV5IGW1_9ROSI|nr:hypothetical protein SLEP1_g10073 [Rubroshorea leprosula]